MSKLYQQKYRKEWEANTAFKGWLKPFIGDIGRAYCHYCKVDFYAKISDVKKHSTTLKHIQKAKPYNSAAQTTLPFMVGKIDSSKKAEATIALAIAEHCSHVGQPFLTPLLLRISECTGLSALK